LWPVGPLFFYNGKEFAHFHNNNLLDLRLDRSLIKENNLVHPNIGHVNRAKSSHWFEYVFRTKKDVEKIVQLFKTAIIK